MSFEPGTVFAGDYRVVKPLNQGGMGAVYVVEQLSTGKMRALKLMHSSLVFDPPSRAKFEQEARIGARIASEHVVEVVAAGVDPQTQVPFLVMELLEGEDMASRLRRGPFHVGEAALVLGQIAHALGAAHDAGVIHRDLKPENVFLGVSKRSMATLVVKLLDFGIAKVTEENTGNTTGAYGTPMWLSPEQTRRGVITPAADVWAFGLLTFFMLTGHPFWRHAEGPQATLPALLQDILNDPIPPASSRAMEFALRLPNGYDAWLARALDRDPRMRFQNAREAWHALAPILSGAGMTMADAVPAQPAPSQPRKSGGALIAVAIALVVLVVGVAGAAIALGLQRKPAAVTSTATTTTPTITTASASPSASAILALMQQIVAASSVEAPPPIDPTEIRIGGNILSMNNNEALQADAWRRFNGDLAHELDQCLPRRSGDKTENANIIVKVARDGSVTSAHPMHTTTPGPVLQCLTDTLSRQKLVATKSGGDLLFTLMWKHP